MTITRTCSGRTGSCIRRRVGSRRCIAWRCRRPSPICSATHCCCRRRARRCPSSPPPYSTRSRCRWGGHSEGCAARCGRADSTLLWWRSATLVGGRGTAVASKVGELHSYDPEKKNNRGNHFLKFSKGWLFYTNWATKISWQIFIFKICSPKIQ